MNNTTINSFVDLVFNEMLKNDIIGIGPVEVLKGYTRGVLTRLDVCFTENDISLIVSGLGNKIDNLDINSITSNPECNCHNCACDDEDNSDEDENNDDAQWEIEDNLEEIDFELNQICESFVNIDNALLRIQDLKDDYDYSFNSELLSTINRYKSLADSCESTKEGILEFVEFAE
jgi:hypothetical protein